MNVPPTADELLDAWAGTHAPTEPSPNLHPSRMLPRTATVVGSPWQAHEHDDGTWSFARNGRIEFGPLTGDVEDVYEFLLRLNRDDPRAETQGHPEWHVTDPLRAARGICLALLISAPIWFAGAYLAGRLTGWRL